MRPAGCQDREAFLAARWRQPLSGRVGVLAGLGEAWRAVAEHALSLGFVLWVVEAQAPSLCLGPLTCLGYLS